MMRHQTTQKETDNHYRFGIAETGWLTFTKDQTTWYIFTHRENSQTEMMGQKKFVQTQLRDVQAPPGSIRLMPSLDNMIDNNCTP